MLDFMLAARSGCSPQAARIWMIPRKAYGAAFLGSAVLLCIAVWESPLLSGQHSNDLKTITLSVSGSQVWTDTKIDLNAGEKIRITASGTIRYAEGLTGGPEGMERGWKDLLRVPPVRDAGRGALIARIGDFDAARAFLVGARLEIVAPISGRLYLGVNEQSGDTAEGSFEARIEVLERGTVPVARLGRAADAKAAPGGEETHTLPPERPIPALTSEFLSQIPRRVTDKDGDPGDMVNFLIIGSEEELKRAFQRGGWVQVDRTKADAVVHGLLSTLSKEEYVEMPMSELYLFGRPQDYGFAHADPYAVIATRHHLRVWRAAREFEGDALWVGAATHDVGFEKDQRNGSVTHKIDPDVDEEREYLARTLLASGAVTQWAHVTPKNPLTQAKTATGGSFHSDGRVLVLIIADGGASAAASK
jgi:hypothetical protein